MVHYCTYFDSRYLSRGLALYRSLLRHSPPFRLAILCLDELAFELLERLKLEHVALVKLAELEAFDPELAATKAHRQKIEYYFTMTPCWTRYAMERFAAPSETVTYLDSDLYLYSSPQPIYDELKNKSALIVPHRFPARLKAQERYGLYNVGWLSFRKDRMGQECLGWWRERCIEWCFDREEDGKFADQKYLDQLPTRFTGVQVLQHPGGGLGPWNVTSFAIEKRGGQLIIDEKNPVIFYHFHKFKIIGKWLFDLGLEHDNRIPAFVRSYFYRPYIAEIRKGEKLIASLESTYTTGTDTMRPLYAAHYPLSTVLRRLRSGKMIFSIPRLVSFP